MKKYFIFGQSPRAVVFDLFCRMHGGGSGMQAFVLSDLSRCKFKVPMINGKPVKDMAWLRSQTSITSGFVAARQVIIESQLKQLFSDIDITLYYVDEYVYQMELNFLTASFWKSFLQKYFVADNASVVGQMRIYDENRKAYFLTVNKTGCGVYPDSRLFADDFSLLHAHERQFGDYSLLEADGKDWFYDKCKIYMAKTAFDHEVATPVNSENTVTIQCGAALTSDRISFLTDADGDNISARNRDYCEMTAVYWAWKNDSYSEYIGLCHYRRRLDLTKPMISSMKAQALDAVFTVPVIEDNTVISEFLWQNWFLDEEEWNLVAPAISKVAPEYLDAWKELADSWLLIPCNMFVMRKEVFGEYCKFVFPVLEEVDRNFLEKGIRKDNRYLGYIAELLTNVFVMAKKATLKKKYVSMTILPVR